VGKKEVALAQLESILTELKEGQNESAATATIGHKENVPHKSGTLVRLIFKVWGLKILIFTIIIVLALSGAFWLYSGNLAKKESTTFVEQVQELSTLATAEAHVKVVLEQEDNKLFGKNISMNIPGTKREVLLIVPATVLAGVDLKGITSQDIKINEKTKELEIVLPHAKLVQDPSIQMDKVQTFSDEGLFRGNVEWDEGFDLASEAQKKIKKEATDIALLQTAEKSADKVLKEFFSTLGYSAKVTFK